MRISISLAVPALAVLMSAAAFAQTPPAAKAPEVIVTGSKTALSPDTKPWPITVITQEDIARSGLVSLKDVIDKVPGTIVSDYGDRSGIKTVSIRASSSEQVLVLVDGRRVSDARMATFDFNNISIETVERIEVLRGAASAVYGADAMAGVINIITKDARQDKRASFEVSGGGFGMSRYSASFFQSFSGANFIVSSAQEDSDGWRDNSWGEAESYMAKGEASLGGYGVASLYTDRTLRKNGSPGSAPVSYSPIDFSMTFSDEWTDASTPDNWSSEDRNSSALEYTFETQKLMSGTPLGFKVNYYLNDYEYAFWQDLSDPYSNGVASMSRHHDTESGYEVVCYAKLKSGSELVTGTESVRDELESSKMGDHSASRKSAFAQYIWKSGEKYTMVLGGRYDDHSVYGTQFSPSASFSFSSGKDSVARISFAKGFRAPTFSDLYWPNDGWSSGNEELQPETATEYEAGLESDKFSLSVFVRDSKDLILWAETSPWFYQPINLSSSRVRGFEIETEQKLANFDTVLNYTYLDPEDRDNGGHIFYKPRHMANVMLSYTMPFEVSLFLDARWNYFYVPAEEKNEAWSDFTVLNAKLSKSFDVAGAKSEIFLGIENVLDERYMAKKGYPMPGRNFVFGIKSEF